MTEFDDAQPIEPGCFSRDRKGGGLPPRVQRQGGEDPHQAGSAPALATRAITRVIKSEKYNVPCHHSCQTP